MRQINLYFGEWAGKSRQENGIMEASVDDMKMFDIIHGIERIKVKRPHGST